MARRTLAALALAVLAGCATPSFPPASRDAPATAPPLQPGDTWTYQAIDGYNRLAKGSVTREVVRAESSEVEVRESDGRGATSQRYDPPWNPVRIDPPRGQSAIFAPPLRLFPYPLEPGRSWREESIVTGPTGERRRQQVYGNVLGWERVTVPAGEFVAVKIRRQRYLGDREWWRSETYRLETDWYAPDVKAVVRHEERDEWRDLTRSRWGMYMNGDWTVWQLTSYRVAP